MSIFDLELDRIKPRGTRVLVTPYVKPETFKGLIVIPETHRRDETNSLFESVRASERAIEELGSEPEEGDILATGPWAAVMVTRDFGFIEAAQIRKRISWREETMVKATGDWVLIEPDRVEVTKGGILLAPVSEESPQTGTVRGVGPKVVEGLSEGARVLFGRYAGNEVEHEGVKFLLMRESAILAEVE